MNVIERIDELMKERNWSSYKLAEQARVPLSTIANMRRRSTIPSIPTLELLCNAFGITLSQFFEVQDASGDTNREEEREDQQVLAKWTALSDERKKLVMDLIRELQ